MALTLAVRRLICPPGPRTDRYESSNSPSFVGALISSTSKIGPPLGEPGAAADHDIIIEGAPTTLRTTAAEPVTAGDGFKARSTTTTESRSFAPVRPPRQGSSGSASHLGTWSSFKKAVAGPRPPESGGEEEERVALSSPSGDRGVLVPLESSQQMETSVSKH